MTHNKKILSAVSYGAASAVFSILVFFYAEFAKTQQVLPTFSASVAPTAEFNISASEYPQTGAQSCALIDAQSGQLLFSKNENERLPMASTTKIMTAIIAIENKSLDDDVLIPKEAQNVEGSSIYLVAGEVLSLRELLYGLMLESGNDAAIAIAIHTAGSVEKFCDMMNEKAKTLGLCNTNFENPHGLSSENHYTTAHELAKIAAYAMKNEDFRKIVATEKYIIDERENCRERYFFNHNRLLRSLDICDGMKTGYTLASGRCLVTSCTVENGRFVAVTLNDRDDWSDHKEMLLFATSNFESVKIAAGGEIFFSYQTAASPKQTVSVTNTEDIYITRKKGEDAALNLSVEIGATSSLVGDTAGYLSVNDKENCFLFPLTVSGVRSADGGCV